MHLIKEKITKEKFQEIAGEETMCKVAVDVKREIVSIGCELHIDCAEQLLQNGSVTEDIWGANVYPKDREIDLVSLINIRPADNNRSMEIQDKEIKQKVETVIKKLLF